MLVHQILGELNGILIRPLIPDNLHRAVRVGPRHGGVVGHGEHVRGPVGVAPLVGGLVVVGILGQLLGHLQEGVPGPVAFLPVFPGRLDAVVGEHGLVVPDALGPGAHGVQSVMLALPGQILKGHLFVIQQIFLFYVWIDRFDDVGHREPGHPVAGGHRHQIRRIVRADHAHDFGRIDIG